MNLPFIEDLIQSINNLLEVKEGNKQNAYKLKKPEDSGFFKIIVRAL